MAGSGLRLKHGALQIYIANVIEHLFGDFFRFFLTVQPDAVTRISRVHSERLLHRPCAEYRNRGCFEGGGQASLPSDCRVFRTSGAAIGVVPGEREFGSHRSPDRGRTASPMPPYPPVTKATLPSSLNNSSWSSCQTQVLVCHTLLVCADRLIVAIHWKCAAS